MGPSNSYRHLKLAKEMIFVADFHILEVEFVKKPYIYLLMMSATKNSLTILSKLYFVTVK
jgi:hypothetical protein